MSLRWAFRWSSVATTILKQLIQELLRTNAHKFAQRPAKRLIPERLTCYLLRYPVYSHANGSNERLADAFVNDLLQQRRHGEILPDAHCPHEKYILRW